MWSEHCSYKSSRRHLKQFPTTGPARARGPGRERRRGGHRRRHGGGLQDGGHNHPSYIEPYQGAATGVGGILRDVFTMGARPIALLNSLRFGDPSHPKTRVAARGRGGGHRRLRQLHRRAHRGRRGVPSTRATTATAWSTPSPWACCARTASSRAPRRAWATRSSTWARRPAATASTARRWPRPSSTRRSRRSGPRCRWATRSPRSCCSRRAWSCSRPTRWWASRTWARRG